MRTAAWTKPRAAVSFCLALVFLLSFSGCAGRDDYRENAINLTAPHGFQERRVLSAPFAIFMLEKNQSPAAPWRVYVEGDGRSYVNYELSLDPTPAQTTVLDLMLTDPAPNILYVARPCQFLPTAACDSKYWSNARYGEDVVRSLQFAIGQVTGPTAQVELIGYSGGGTIALLLAPRMGAQVTGVRTIAANLAVKEQTAYFHLTPLDQSLDPMDLADRLNQIPQIHLTAAEDDKVIPDKTVRHYAEALNSSCDQIVRFKDVTHQGPWGEIWKNWQSAALPRCPPAIR